MKNIIASFLICLLLPLTVYAQNSRLPGDLDGDGTYTVFDLLGMLGHLYQEAPYIDYADIDTDSDNDIADLLFLLKIIADEYPGPEPFDYALIIDNYRIDEYAELLDVQNSSSEDPQYNMRYHVYSNREINDFEFVIDGDSITESLAGEIPLLYAKDTLGYVVDSNYYDLRIARLDSIKWTILLSDSAGNSISDFGYLNISIAFDLCVDGGYPSVGNEISFPLILDGEQQKFSFYHPYYYIDSSTVVDLNPTALPKVFYPDIDSLCITINRNTVFGNGYERYYATPVYDSFTGKRTNRLAFVIFNIGWAPPPNPLGGNKSLADKLGFPDWIREIGSYYDYRYRPDIDWFKEKYPDEFYGR